ncbi:MAG: outer membrane beta-barrel protein [Candidatus Midichloria sp.]|nr:outer membrane beta-barrel protein [Candidatus Midichloria sp.]
MKKISMITLVAAVLSTATAYAKSPIMDNNSSDCGRSDYYFRMGVGYGWIPGNTKLDIYAKANGTKTTGTEITTPTSPTISGLKLGKDSHGGFVAPAIGMHVNDNIRTDLELHYYYPQYTKYGESHDLKDIAVDHKGASETILKRESWSVLANGFYDFKMNDSKLVPFIGIGIGYGQTKFAVADLNYKISATNATVSIDESTLTESATKKNKNSFLYGGTLGLGYQLACNTRIEVAYMIQNLAKAETKLADKMKTQINNTQHLTATGQFKGYNLMHAIRVGMVVSF